MEYMNSSISVTTILSQMLCLKTRKCKNTQESQKMGKAMSDKH